MGRVSILLYITIGITLIFFLSRNHPNDHHNHRTRRHGHGHRHLKVKSNFTFTSQDHPDPNLGFRYSHHHDPTPFDPVVAGIERHREDKEWERMYIEERHKEIGSIARAADLASKDHAPGHEEQPEWEDFMDGEDYLNDEEKFNVTSRLVVLFPKIDVDPTDGFVSEVELVDWQVKQTEKEVLHRTQREMELHDKNKDGFVAFSEYVPPSWVNSATSGKGTLIKTARLTSMNSSTGFLT